MKEQVLEISKHFDPLYGIEYDITDSKKGINLLDRIVSEPNDLIRYENAKEAEELFWEDVDNNFREQVEYVKSKINSPNDISDEVREILEDNFCYNPMDVFLQKIGNVSFAYKTGMFMEYEEFDYIESETYQKKFYENILNTSMLDNIGYKYIKTLFDAGQRGDVVFFFKLDKESIEQIIQSNCDIEFNSFKIGIVDYDNGQHCVISDVINQKIKVPFKHENIIVDDNQGSYAATIYYIQEFLDETDVKIISND